MTPIEIVATLFLILMSLVPLYMLWDLYSTAKKDFIETSRKIQGHNIEIRERLQNLKRKSKEICKEAETFLTDENNHKKFKEVAIDILATSISRGLQDAHLRITERKEVENRRSRSLERTN